MCVYIYIYIYIYKFLKFVYWNLIVSLGWSTCSTQSSSNFSDPSLLLNMLALVITVLLTIMKVTISVVIFTSSDESFCVFKLQKQRTGQLNIQKLISLAVRKVSDFCIVVAINRPYRSLCCILVMSSLKQ